MFSTIGRVNPAVLESLYLKLSHYLIENKLVINSHDVAPNSIFCAYPGTSYDGRDYIEDAINKGANFILWEIGNNFTWNISNYAVHDLMLYVGLLVAKQSKHPSRQFKTIGVTGTNGKTSITYWLNQIYAHLGSTSGIIGTTGSGMYPQMSNQNATTPDPIALHQLLTTFATKGASMVAIEVSSHALKQGRVNGVTFDTAIFTNLTQDHLDYHKTMEEYYLAKHELFYWQDLQNIIINTDDPYGMRLYDELQLYYAAPNCDNAKLHSPINILTYGIKNGNLYATDINLQLSGITFILNYNSEKVFCSVKMLGQFNLYNLLAVSGVLINMGYSLNQIAPLLAILNPVVGRMDLIRVVGKPLVVIDYAHTPDALQNVLQTLKQIMGQGKLYCVFGCGGNRDMHKRSIMGGIATSLADYSIITSDNPRFEDPNTIIQHITMNISQNNYIQIALREEAIQYALQLATADDVVLIAGKGHETYQEILDHKYPFSDSDVVYKCFKG